MTHNSWILAVATVALVAACRTAPGDGGAAPASTPTPSTSLTPPIARVAPTALEKHGKTRSDEYFWLRERENEEVLSYLRAENAYADAVLAPTSELQETIFKEIVARIPQQDESVPVFENGWHWVTRYEPGKEYPIYARKKAPDAADEVVLDVNELAKGHTYFSVPGVQPSDSGNLIVYAVDTVGRRKYDLHFKNLATGQTLPDVIDDVTPNAVWAADEKTVLYTRQDPDTLRSFQIWRHEIGTDPKSDVLVYEETDEEFSSYVYRSKSKKFIMIGSSQTLADEVRYLDALDPAGAVRVLEPRKRGREYSADHLNGFFYIRTNDGGRNFRIMRAPESSPGFANWSEVVGHREDVYIDSFELFNDYLVLGERKDGLMRLHVMPWGGEGHFVDFGEPAYVARIADNPEASTRTLRFVYSSLTTPWSTYDYDIGGRPLSHLITDARRELLEAAWDYTRTYRDVPLPSIYGPTADEGWGA